MNRDSIIDYSACILIRLLGPIIRSLPNNFAYFLGRRLGEAFYYFDLKHKTIAYANLKMALGDKLSAYALSTLAKKFYQNFGQSLIELFMIPLVDKEYMKKYINIEGLDYIYQGFKKGKGVMLVSVHAGSWELSNIICANLGFSFVLFVRDQRYPRLNRILNSYRSAKGCKIIQRQNQLRQLVEALKHNQAIGMTVDQGGKSGVLTKFFGRDAAMASGAVRLALRYDSALIPVFYTRLNGAKFKVIIKPPLEMKRTGDLEKDVDDNLKDIISIFEGFITKYPQEYLWTYKIWKYAKTKNILILSDGKVGHLHQGQALANIISGYYLKDKGIKVDINTVEVKFKSKLARLALTWSSCFSGKYHCQGCLWCVRTFLKEGIYRALIVLKPDIIISCGSSVAPINYILSRENVAKSIVIMRPSILSMRRFDLVIMNRHDLPPKRKNIVLTEGALNLIDEDYLSRESEELIRVSGVGQQLSGFCIGLLIGGDTKHFSLSQDMMQEVIKQIKSAAKNLNADILVTTSRRTSREIEDLSKKEFQDYSACKLLVIANEKNIPETVGGILGLSQIVVVSGESISMISEAASSGKYVLVFKSPVTLKHKRFLNYIAGKKYIYLCQPHELLSLMEKIYQDRPVINTLNDRTIIKQALARIL